MVFVDIYITGSDQKLELSFYSDQDLLLIESVLEPNWGWVLPDIVRSPPRAS
jgi:hypothetical protein